MNVITNTSLSKATSYQEIGEFWDNQDLTDFWEHTQAVTFDVDIQAEQRYYRVDHSLAEQVGNIARQRGISPCRVGKCLFAHFPKNPKR